jgi:hypothetical protein
VEFFQKGSKIEGTPAALARVAGDYTHLSKQIEYYLTFTMPLHNVLVLNRVSSINSIFGILNLTAEIDGIHDEQYTAAASKLL